MNKIFPENFESKIGFDRIRELLKSACLSPLGKDRVDAVCFGNNTEIIRAELSLTGEFSRLLAEQDNFPTSYYLDLRPALARIRTEGRFLEIHELFDLKRSLDTVSAIVRFLQNLPEERYPFLKKLLLQIRVSPYVSERIEQILSPYGKIKDQASPELDRIRRELLSLQGQVSKRLHSILKEARREGIVEEDASVSIRDGRPVIPVAAGLKRKLDGIIHDESASGKTSFIEPVAVVEMNNRIRELEYAEKREIIRILIEFADDIRPHLEELDYSYQFMGTIDFLRAKAVLALRMQAIEPVVENRCLIEWKRAVHPLLKFSLEREKRSVVPLDIRLTEEKHILLISGPNAGGKSVCLKTVGLLQYMLQCGLLIPVDETSRTGIFDRLFIDIGDEQSIENDLSTYSSHLMNMKFFLKYADAKTLILIDEFGTGTEPLLGGAIAEAILGQLNRQGAFGLVTTHYTNLKHYAASAQGIENGAMLYDTGRMEPLFRLEAGKPGSSFAFEIARKIGMPEQILQEATDKIGKDHIDFDKHLRDILRDKRYWESKRQRIRKVEKTLEEVSVRYESDLKKLKEERRQILEDARSEAGKILDGVNKTVENTIREIRESQAEKEKTRTVRQELEVFREELAKSDTDNDVWINRRMEKIRRKREKRKDKQKTKPAVKPDPKEQAKDPEPGDLVRIKGQQNVGEVLEVGPKNMVVAFGQLRSSVSRSRLEPVSGNEARKEIRRQNRTRANINSNLAEKRLNFKADIDVRGQRAEEALVKVRTLVDEAVMLNVNELRILHGKGTGILKEMIRNYLKSDPVVSSFRDEHVQFGGAGITIVELG
ncbi:MAG: endonuclease MutS2 [Mangrovibacterium sp.]